MAQTQNRSGACGGPGTHVQSSLVPTKHVSESCDSKASSSSISCSVKGEEVGWHPNDKTSLTNRVYEPSFPSGLVVSCVVEPTVATTYMSGRVPQTESSQCMFSFVSKCCHVCTHSWRWCMGGSVSQQHSVRVASSGALSSFSQRAVHRPDHAPG